MPKLPIIPTLWGNFKSRVMNEPTHISVLAELNRERWESYLPWQLHDPATGLWHNKTSVGRLYEFDPLYFAGEDTLCKMAAMLSGNWPEMAAMQFICHGSDYMDPIVHRWLAGITTTNPLLLTAAQMQAEFLKKGRSGIREFQGMPVRNNRHFWTSYFPAPKDRFRVPKEWTELMDGAEQGLASGRLNPRPISPDEFVDWWFRFYNDKVHLPRIPYNPFKTIDEHLIKADTPIDEYDDHLKIGDKYVYCLAPKAMPQKPHPFDVRQLIGGTDGPISDRMQYRCPFIWTTTLIFDMAHIKTDTKTKLNIASTQQFAGAIFKDQVARYQDLQDIQGGIVKGVPNVWALPVLVLYGTDRRQVEASVSNAISGMWANAGFEMAVERDMKKTLFLAAQPFGFESTRENINTIQRMNVANAPGGLAISPIQGDYRGFGREAQELYAGRNGQLVVHDPWAGTSYNALTVAPTGKGKSVDLNWQIFCALLRGEKVIAFEKGNSLAPLCHIAKGRHVTFHKNPKNITCLNMFQMFSGDMGEFDVVSGNYMQWSTIIYNMAFAHSGKPAADVELAVLIDAVKHVYEQYGPESHIGHVADFLQRIEKRSSFLQENKDLYKDNLIQFAHNTAYVLHQYGWTPGGQYDRWVNGKNTLNIVDDPMTLFEVQDLDDKVLFNVITLLLMSVAQQAVWKLPREIKKTIAIDESPVFFEDIISMAKYLGEWLRQIRKLVGRVNLIAQALTDFERMADNILSIIINNSARRKMLGMGADQIQAAIRLGVVDESQKGILATVNSVENQYSEIAVLMQGGGIGVQRLVLSKYLLAMFTTDKVDRPRINEITNNMLNSFQPGEFMAGYRQLPQDEDSYKAVITDLAIRQFVKERWGEGAL